MRPYALALVVAVVLAAVLPAHAVQPDEILPDAGLERRARAISAELRCMVCQNQSIDDSDAPLARDLRLIVRERLKAGDSDAAVMAYLVDRYGEFVLLRPRFAGATAVLWIAPAALLALGVLGLFVAARRRRAVFAAPEPTLTDEERRQLAELERR